MLKLNKILLLNKRGFSLIELMVALTVLAIFVLGIVYAFTNSFQAMAEAKQRTVATNLAQQKIEELRYSVDVKFPTYIPPYGVSVDGTDYNITVTNEDAGNKMTNVYVTVGWETKKKMGDKDVQRSVMLSTQVYEMKTFEDESPVAASLKLSATPTDLPCCQDKNGDTPISRIIAEVFDQNENRFPAAGTPVKFEATEGGEFINSSTNTIVTVTDSIGRAEAQLTLKKGYDLVEVSASVGMTKSEPETIEIKCKPIEYFEVVLSASPEIVLTNEASTITAIVLNSCGERINFENNKTEDIDVTFTTTFGSFESPGSVKEKTVKTVNGKAEVTIHKNTLAAGNVSDITATVVTPDEEFLTDEAKVYCTDYTITLGASSNSIFPHQVSAITATLKKGNSFVSNKTINFETDFGYLNPKNSITNNSGKATVELSELKSEQTATVRATFELPDSGGKTISATTQVDCLKYTYSLTIDANPKEITTGDSSVITATLTNEAGPVVGRRIMFNSSNTSTSLSKPFEYTDDNGKAEVTLSDLGVGESTVVSATSDYDDKRAEITVTRKSTYNLEIDATPNIVFPNGSSTIKVTLTDGSGNPVRNQRISLNTNRGSLRSGGGSGSSNINVTTNNSGEATATLSGLTANSTATVTATYSTLSESVQVQCNNNRIVLESESSTIWPNKRVLLTATLTVSSGSAGSKSIKFETDQGLLYTATTGGNGSTSINRNTNGSGIATIYLQLTESNSVATVNASYSGVSDSVSVKYVDTYITKEREAYFNTSGSNRTRYVNLDLELNGGPITLDNVKINWDLVSSNPTMYTNLSYAQPKGGSLSSIFTYNGRNSNRDLIAYLSTNPMITITKNNTFKIQILFNNIITSRNGTLIFNYDSNDPNAKHFQVDFTTPRS